MLLVIFFPLHFLISASPITQVLSCFSSFFFSYLFFLPLFSDIAAIFFFFTLLFHFSYHIGLHFQELFFGLLI